MAYLYAQLFEEIYIGLPKALKKKYRSPSLKIEAKFAGFGKDYIV